MDRGKSLTSRIPAHHNSFKCFVAEQRRALVVNMKAIKRTRMCQRVRAHTELYETCISEKWH